MDVNYRPSSGPDSCSSCANYQADGTCVVVEGPISGQYVSDLFQPTEGDMNPLPIDQPGVGGGDLASQLFGGL